jgi:hypothetical protein
MPAMVAVDRHAAGEARPQDGYQVTHSKVWARERLDLYTKKRGEYAADAGGESYSGVVGRPLSFLIESRPLLIE